MTRAMPWYMWCAGAAVTSAMIGVHWDISWHRSIGRDTFWTPAHIAIYLCGILGGISSAFLILSATFGRGAEAAATRAASVRIWGFRGPIGAFIMAWGGIAMLTSAPFDDWWHNAYGLDVRIISPPHTVLAAGIFSVMLGALLLVTGLMNRSSGERRRMLGHIYVFLGGLVVVNMATFVMEEIFNVAMHRGFYYRAVALALPFYLTGLARACDLSWPATRIAAVYMLFWAAMNWILPLFPAEPKLGPVLNPVTRFVPSYFPMLLVIPAFGVDLVLRRASAWPAWRTGLAAGAVFTALLLAAQWPFGEFLMSPWASNWFFFGGARDYRTPATSFSARRIFLPAEPAFAWNLAAAFAAACVTSWLGLNWGSWLRKVRR